MASDPEQKRRLEQGVWLDEVDRAFRSWRAAPSGDKATHLLTGMTLTWAENWRLTNPKDFSPATHTFIARSIATQALKSSSEREAQAAETRRRDRVYQQILLLMALFAIVILGPSTMRLYLEQPNHQSAVAQPQPVVAPPVIVDAEPAARPVSPQAPKTTVGTLSPAVLIDTAQKALRRGDRVGARRHALEALFAAPEGSQPLSAVSMLADLGKSRQAADPSSQLTDVDILRPCSGARLLIGTASGRKVLDTATRALAPVGPATAAAPITAIDAACRQALTTDADYNLAVADLATDQVRRLGSHEATIVGMHFAANGHRAVSVSRDGVGMVWNLDTRRRVSSFRSPTDTFHGAVMNATGTRVVTWSDQAKAELWDAATGTALGGLIGHASAVVSASFTADGTRLLTVSVDGTANVWSVTSRDNIATLRPTGGAIVEARLTPSANRVIARLDDDKLQIWDLDRAEPLVTVDDTGGADVVAMQTDGILLAIAGADGTVTVWDGSAGIKRLSLQAGARVLALTFVDAQTLKATTSEGATVWALPLTRAQAVVVADGQSLCAAQAGAPWCTSPQAESELR